MHETDETIYRRFLDGRSDDDMRILLERHREGLTLFLTGIVRVGGRSSFRTWLFGIGRKLALTHLRRRRLLPEVPEAFADEAAVSRDLGLISEERSRTLYAAMSKLNGDYRQILCLLYFEEMSHEEAARVMGRSVKQTYNLAHRARQALRETLERMGFEYAGY